MSAAVIFKITAAEFMIISSISNFTFDEQIEYKSLLIGRDWIRDIIKGV